MKTRTLLRDRGHSVPVQAYHGHRAEPQLKENLDGPEGALSPEDWERNAAACEQSAPEWVSFCRAQANRLRDEPPGNPLEMDMR